MKNSYFDRMSLRFHFPNDYLAALKNLNAKYQHGNLMQNLEK